MKLDQVKGINVTPHQETRNFPLQGRCGMLKCTILDQKSVLRIAEGTYITF